MRLLVATLFWGLLTTTSVLFAQQGNPQKIEQELDDLKKEVGELKKQLKGLEDIGKLELAAKYFNAQDKLLNTEFDYLKRKLTEHNRNWLLLWVGIFSAIFGLVGTGVFVWARNTMRRRIEDVVEVNLEGFKNALKQLEILQEGYTFSVLDSTARYPIGNSAVSQATRPLQKEPLLKILGNKEYVYEIRHRAAEVLAEKGLTAVVPDLLNFLNAVYDDTSPDTEFSSMLLSPPIWGFLRQIGNDTVYESLRQFLERILLEDSPRSESFIPSTALALGWLSVRLGKTGSISLLERAIPRLRASNDFLEFVKVFGKINHKQATECIKEILKNHTDARSDVKEKCLELLQDKDPKFVAEFESH